MTHFQITQASLISLAGNIVTVVVAFVPAWSPQQQLITATLGGLISNLFPVVNAIHAHGAKLPAEWPVPPAPPSS